MVIGLVSAGLLRLLPAETPIPAPWSRPLVAAVLVVGGLVVAAPLILTGQLGDVMKESAQAALTLLKARARALGADPAVFEKSDIHMHIPAGAIPKDGPSAGVAMFTSLR